MSDDEPRILDSVINGQPARVVLDAQPIDLLALSSDEFDIYLAGRRDGRIEGLTDGYRLAAEETDRQAAALHHRAYTIVQAFADIPTHEELERRRRSYNLPGTAA